VITAVAVVSILLWIEWWGSVGFERITVVEDPELVRGAVPKMELPNHLFPRFTVQSTNDRINAAVSNWSITRFDSSATGEFLIFARFLHHDHRNADKDAFAAEVDRLLIDAGRAARDETLTSELVRTYRFNVCESYDPACDSDFVFVRGKGHATGRKFWHVSGLMNTRPKTLLILRLRSDQWNERKLSRLLNSIDRPHPDVLFRLAKEGKIRVVLSDQANDELKKRNLTAEHAVEAFRRGSVLWGEQPDAEPWPTFDLKFMAPDTTFFYRTTCAFDRSKGVVELLQVSYQP
jgi:hypothetical protein